MSFVYKMLGFGSSGSGPTFGMQATGGTVTTSGDYTIHKITASAQNFIVSALGTDVTYGNKVEYLVCAGGGGCGLGHGGGGGAGGYRTNGAYDHVVTAQTYTVPIGAGGANAQIGTQGGTSTFDTIASAGGGGGAGGIGNGGLDGGSGGGSCLFSIPGGSGNTPATTPSQGNNGGLGCGPPGVGMGSGGGGSGTAGPPAGTNGPSNGGSGTANSIGGTSVTYTTGGGGEGSPSYGGQGPGVPNGPGPANTGQGGGEFGGVGGTGVVFIKYKWQ